jgi:hypothetical protein
MPTQVIRFDVQAQTVWQVRRNERTQVLVGVCDALGLVAEGDTYEDLASVIFDIQNHLFRTLLAEGSLPRFLAKHGWRAQTPLPVAVPPEGIRFDLPPAFIAAQANSSAASAL